MKTTIYLRIGKDNKLKKGIPGDRIRVEATEKPNFAPLKIGQRFIPTVSFGVEFEIPDELFKGAGLIVGLLKLTTEQAKIAMQIKVPKMKP